MNTTFYTLLTARGAADLTNAYANGTTVNLTHLAVGDGNGAFVTPVEGMTALVREVHRVPISSLMVDPQNNNWLIAEGAISSMIGGFTVREVGLFSNLDHLIAVGNFPDTYNPTLAEGSGRDLLIRMIIQTSAAAQVNLVIDPSVVVATVGSINSAIYAHNKPATEVVVGHLQLASTIETIAGLLNSKAAHPAGIKAAIDFAVTKLIAGSSTALDTLNELAIALNNDPDFATTIINMLGSHNTSVSAHDDIRTAMTKAGSGRYFYSQI